MAVVFRIEKISLVFCLLCYIVSLANCVPIESQSHDGALGEFEADEPAEYAYSPTNDNQEDLLRVARGFNNPFVFKRMMVPITKWNIENLHPTMYHVLFQNSRVPKARHFYRSPFILKRDDGEIYVSKDSYNNPFVLRDDGSDSSSLLDLHPGLKRILMELPKE